MKDGMIGQIEKFEADYEKIFSKGVWTREDIENMKDLKKLEYYIKVIDAMDGGEGYPGSEYMEDDKRSYARGMMHRRPNGQFASGKMYYDNEKEDAIHKLHKVMDSESNPKFKMAIQEAIHMLEAR